MQQQDFSMLAIGICWLASIFITYIFQYIKIIKYHSVEGISSHFMILGNVSSITAFMNSLVFYLSVFRECPTIDPIECLNRSLGLYQIACQFICFIILYVLFVIFYKSTIHHTYNTFSSTPPPSEPLLPQLSGRKRHLPLFVVSLTVDILLIMVTIIILQRNAWTGDDDVGYIYARTLGLISTMAVIGQYTPQIFKLYQIKHPRTLSIITYILLSVGNFVSFFYLVMQDASDFTTWMPYAISLLLQVILVAQIVYYNHRTERLSTIINYSGSSSDLSV